ncbi:MAG: putative ABC transporter permease, partial [Eubacteriales bacterium]|nr:putative ABC transporter permease [Eubacteriales bacterium]
MMRMLFLFFIYSFLGWVLETVSVTLKQRKIVNRGFLNGPLCMIYGITAVMLTINLTSLRDNIFFLFLGSVIYATFIEWAAGIFLEKFYHGRWWDYSEKRWNFEGYICFSHSMFWGLLGVIVIKWLNPVFLKLYNMGIPVLMHTVMWVLLAVLILDILGTTAALSGAKERVARYEKSNRWIARITAALRERIYGAIEKRILKAYPLTQPSAEKEKSGVFAEGCGFYKLFWLFMIGAFLGDIVETVFCRITMGQWMSRSSVVWGPFSIVWGLAIAIFTALLYQQRNRSESFLFIAGTLLGGAFEYFCSVFTEMAFGTVFWDYSHVPFNLAGRINLLYCFFWGIAAVVWFKVIYGRLEALIERIPKLPGKIITWVLVLFMACNIGVSCLALGRYQERRLDVEATAPWQQIMDEYYNDDVMRRIYPKAKGLDMRGVPAEEAASE